jgi:hypothetical protein
MRAQINSMLHNVQVNVRYITSHKLTGINAEPRYQEEQNGPVKTAEMKERRAYKMYTSFGQGTHSEAPYNVWLDTHMDTHCLRDNC